MFAVSNWFKNKTFQSNRTTHSLLIKHSKVTHLLGKQIPSECFSCSALRLLIKWLSFWIATTILRLYVGVVFSLPRQPVFLRHTKGNQEELGSPQKQLYARGRENIFPYMCTSMDTTQFTRQSSSCPMWDNISWTDTITNCEPENSF